MIFRPQRGGLAESMAAQMVIDPPTYAELAYWLGEPAKDIEVKAYGYDERIDWHTYIVTVRGNAVGFTNAGVL